MSQVVFQWRLTYPSVTVYQTEDGGVGDPAKIMMMIEFCGMAAFGNSCTGSFLSTHHRKRKRESKKQEDADIRRLSLYNVLLMRCNFGLLGNINVIVKFCSASDVMHERRLAPHDDYHLSSYYYYRLTNLLLTV